MDESNEPNDRDDPVALAIGSLTTVVYELTEAIRDLTAELKKGSVSRGDRT